jgi:hypothetical protein
VAKPAPTVEKALAELQRLIRRPPPKDPPRTVMTWNVPEDLQREDLRSIGLFPDERRALERVRALIAQDLRFEYLKEREVDQATWRFVYDAHVQGDGDLIPKFVAEHSREPKQRTCFFPIELLSIKKEVALFGVRLLPPNAAEPPNTLFGPDPRATMAGVVAVECTGTNYDNMSKRARVRAERALRLLRATMREHRFLPDFQLRFLLGDAMWFDDEAAGWTRDPGEGSELELDEELLRTATSQELAKLPEVPTNDVERRVDLALRWFERAQLAVDPMIELLYLFFALESILGDKSEGLKAPALAVRRAMLGLVTSGGFVHPARTYLLYDQVRSTAVHGEEPPEIDQDEVNQFAWDVRRALNEYIQFAREKGLTKRSKVRVALDRDERREGIVKALIEQDPKLWGRYLSTPSDDGEPAG